MTFGNWLVFDLSLLFFSTILLIGAAGNIIYIMPQKHKGIRGREK